MSPYEYYSQIEKPIAQIFYSMSSRGICVDLGYLDRLKGELEAQKLPIETEIKNELGDINLNSPKQLLEALNEKGIFPIFKGKGSTDKRALGYYTDNKVVSLLLEFSQLDTLLTSFVMPYLERGTSVVHPFFNQCGTRTGRLSCSNPNLLQIPKHSENGQKVRKMFKPRMGMQLGDCDYSGIEPWCLAVMSQDPAMLQMFANGTNFHDYFANHLNIERRIAKVFDLETYYGATKYGVAKTLDCSLDKAEETIEMAWQLFPTLRRWRDKVLYDARKSGYAETFYGRRIKFDDLDSNNEWKRCAAERRVMNNITQGTASEIIKFGMKKVVLDARLHPQFGLLIQVYDQLVAESPVMEQDIQYMAEDMQSAVDLGIPLVVDAKIGPNWGEVHDIN